jgi:hypothetical protein
MAFLLPYISEDAEVLHGPLLALSQKYDMPTVLSTVRSEIGRQLPTTEAAFRAYATATSKELIPEMEVAVRLTRSLHDI